MLAVFSQTKSCTLIWSHTRRHDYTSRREHLEQVITIPCIGMRATCWKEAMRPSYPSQHCSRASAEGVIERPHQHRRRAADATDLPIPRMSPKSVLCGRLFVQVAKWLFTCPTPISISLLYHNDSPRPQTTSACRRWPALNPQAVLSSLLTFFPTFCANLRRFAAAGRRWERGYGVKLFLRAIPLSTSTPCPPPPGTFPHLHQKRDPGLRAVWK